MHSRLLPTRNAGRAFFCRLSRLRKFLACTLTLSACVARTPVAEPPSSLPHADAEYFAEHPLMVPVHGVSSRELRDSFNAPRGPGRIHAAIDILAPRGTPVVAAIGGVVQRLAQNSAGGITAYLVDDARKYIYYYAHLEGYSDAITEGLEVRQGFVIGFVGTSGNAPPDTPHLHFQVMRLREGQRDWWNGTPVDVRSFMRRTGNAIE